MELKELLDGIGDEIRAINARYQTVCNNTLSINDKIKNLEGEIRNLKLEVKKFDEEKGALVTNRQSLIESYKYFKSLIESDEPAQPQK